MKLAEFSCQKEMKAIHDAEGVKYVPFNAFNMHTHRPNMNPFPSVQVE
jgi:hypothetical protein